MRQIQKYYEACLGRLHAAAARHAGRAQTHRGIYAEMMTGRRDGGILRLHYHDGWTTYHNLLSSAQETMVKLGRAYPRGWTQ